MRSGTRTEYKALFGDTFTEPVPRDTDWPEWPEDVATWWQLYENVSEGTPLSPPFPTKECLRAWLLTYGDDWERRRADKDNRPVELPSEAGVDALLDGGYAPTMTGTAVKNAEGETVGYTDLKDSYGAPVTSKP